jgi:hypothetical protein
VHQVHVVRVVGEKRVPQPHGISVLLIRWSAGKENSQELITKVFWALCLDVLLDVVTQIHPRKDILGRLQNEASMSDEWT